MFFVCVVLQWIKISENGKFSLKRLIVSGRILSTYLPSPPPEIPEETENPISLDEPENPVEPNPTPPTQQQPSSPNEEKEAEPINYKVLLLVAGGGGVVIGGTTITISIIRKKKRKKMSGWR